MAEIKWMLLWRHLRGEPNFQIMHYKAGRLKRSGPGLSFWFSPLSASLAEVPLDDRELPFHFTGRSKDFQELNVQGVMTYRVVDPDLLAKRVDFSIDVRSGEYINQPLERLSVLLTHAAQQLALEYVANTSVGQILGEGVEVLRHRIDDGLAKANDLSEMGLEVATVRIASVRPSADLEKALQMPTRESIQETSDQATFQRRALAVENERAIQENELKNQIELAKREAALIVQRSENEKRLTQEDNARLKLKSLSRAERDTLAAGTEAEAIRVVEASKVSAERARMEIYRGLPTHVMLGLAAREFAGKLQSIEHLSVSPELLGPMMNNLIRAGTERLKELEE